MRDWFSHKRMGVSVLALAALLLLSTAAWGQTATSGLVGVVTDPQGAAVVGAQVTLTSRATGAVRSVRTNEQGLYRFVALAPGRYDLRIEVEGFRAAVRENLELQVSITVEFNVTLELGAVTETIVIEEGAATLNTTDASIGNVIGENLIQNIPMEGRNIVGLLSVQAGATYIPTTNPNTEDPRYGSVSGARADQSNVTLDGVDVNDAQNQSAYTAVVPVTLDSVQEFRVTTSNYDASMGRSSGAQVSLVTKPGTNEIHGTTYWYHRNTATSANEYFQKLSQLGSGAANKPPLLQKHIYGAAAGGPFIKDRWFVFGNFEALKEQRETSVERAVPSNSFRDGVMIYQCATASQCPGGTVAGLTGSHSIPAGFYGMTPANLASVDPLGIGPNVAAAQHFRRYPAPNDPGRDGIGGTTTGNIVGFRFGGPLVNTFFSYILRSDFNIDPQGNHKVFWRGNLRDDTVDGAPTFPGNPPQTQFLNNSRGMAVGYDAVISPKLVNSFRYGLSRIGNKQAGLRNSDAVTFRFISDFDALTSTNFRIVPLHNIVNTTSYTHGSHSFQWGINFRFVRAPRATNAISFHTATTNGSWVPGVGRTYIPGTPTCTTPGCSTLPAVASGFHASYADSFINILAILSQASARYNYLVDGTVLASGTPIERKYGSDEYEMFFQDSWRIKPNLTFNFGLRYGIYSPPWEVNGQQVAPAISLGEWFRQRGRNAERGIPSNAIPPFMFDLAGPANGRRGFYDWDYNNFAPRVSVAYSPRFSDGWLGWLTGNGKMVIRGGYSIVYDRIGQGLATTFDTGGSFGLSTSLTSPFGGVSESTPGVRFVNLTTMPPHLPAAPPGGFPTTPPIAAGIITTALDDTITTPYAHAFNFSIGREIPWGMTVEAAYVGRRGRDLLTRYDLAMPVNLLDTVSGMDYFTAARLVIDAIQGIPGSAGSNFTGIAPIPYWENLFPGAAGVFGGASLTATQSIARRFWIFEPDYITALWQFDQFCFPACSIFGPFAYFNDQYDALSAQGSIGWSEYHGMQLTIRRPMSRGFGFDFNYTLSKSNDIGSQVERGASFGNFFTGGYTGFLVNSWDPAAHYAPSDFDSRHQFNFAGIFELPFGRGRRWASGVPSALNHVIGGWQLAGLWRWSSPFPFNVINCRSCWATNWNLQGNAMLADPSRLPATKTTKGVSALGGRPSPFVDPVAARGFFRFQYPGEVGLRNRLRGDGYFTIDLGVGKTWDMPWLEGHKLMFRWETFNITNTVKFDVGNITAFPDISASFGRYNSSLAACDGAAGRCMQFAFRYQF